MIPALPTGNRHPLSRVPDERRGLSGPDQRDLSEQVRHAGGLLLDPHGRRLWPQCQGCSADWADYPGQEAE